ncbi:MAG: M1 family metallopeptidase [Chitinophagales bacterium]
MQIIAKLLLLFFITTGFFIQPKAQETDEFSCLIVDHNGALREQFVDFEKLVLNLRFNARQKQVYGIANYNFKPLRTDINTLFLDAPNIKVNSVKLNSKVVTFLYVEGGIEIDFGTTLNWEKIYDLRISYIAKPLKGIYFVGWKDPTNRARKQIWTQGQGIDNRHWIPGFDAVNDKLVTETIIDFEKGYEVISNGKLISKVDKSTTTTWHYAMEKPHSLYLVMLAIGKYEYRDYASNTGITSRQYYYPDRADAEKTTYMHTNKMMNWFQEELGVPYQWEIYKNVPVRDFMYGAMENTSATIYTDYYLQTEREALERSYVATNAHELAHHWFGDLVTEWSGKHHWLHESFATNYAKHFIKEVEGEEEYQWKKRLEQRAALRASKRNDLPVAHSESGSSRHYPKGSFVIDMLRYVVGEAEYKKTVSAFLKENAFGMVDTHDFQMAFMKHLGMDLDWFFKQWIYKGGEPEYEVNYKTKFNKTIFTVAQVQEQNSLVGLFKMPIKFQVHYKDGSYDEATEWIQNKIDTVEIKNSGLKKVSFVLFDAGSNVLKKVKFDKPIKELIKQAEFAPKMIDRYDAVKALEKIEVDKKREYLVNLYLLEDFRALKQNILAQLKNDKAPKVMQLFVYGMGDKHAMVRRAAIQNANISSKRYIKFYEEMLEDDSYVNIEIALKKLCYEYPDRQQIYLNQTRSLEGKNYSLKLAWLNIGFENNAKLAGGIVDYTSESFEFRTRIKAINIIREKQFYNTAYIKNLINAYLSFNRRLRGAASKHLEELLAEKESGIKISKYVSSLKLLPHQVKDLDNLLEKYNRKVYK